MQIIGLTGPIGSGKTTFAHSLAKHADHAQHWESWQLVAEIANQLRLQSTTPKSNQVTEITNWLAKLPELTRAIIHARLEPDYVVLTDKVIADDPEHYQKLFEYLDGIETGTIPATEPITENNKEACRSLLQWLGAFLVVKIGPGAWYDEILRRIAATEGLTLATIGGVRFPGDAERITAAGGLLIKIERPGTVIRDANDPTERERNRITPNTTISNDGTMQQLDALAQIVHRDILADQLRSNYTTTS